MWDAGPAGTCHRKKGLGGGGLRTGTDIPKEEKLGRGREKFCEKVEMRSPSIFKLHGSKEILCKAGEMAELHGEQSEKSALHGERWKLDSTEDFAVSEKDMGISEDGRILESSPREGIIFVP